MPRAPHLKLVVAPEGVPPHPKPDDAADHHPQAGDGMDGRPSFPGCCTHVLADVSSPDGTTAWCGCGASWTRTHGLWMLTGLPAGTRPRTVCCVCQRETKPAVGIPEWTAAPVSHGLCDGCLLSEYGVTRAEVAQ